ncbi:AAA family ATPase [Bacillus sp. CGMCC 1.16607]|uniref:phosphotransferase-like protein n=1 Tax=Bacillus sp. CGMCC 1.16607 TaxID=3351842 RepID=UPI00364593AC
MEKGKIVFLNGVSSSGKSTLSKELLKKLPNYFHYSIDDFDMVIERMEDRENERLIPVPTEYFFHRTIAMFSEKGVNLIIDQILHDEVTINDCYEILSDYPILFIGVHCPEEELERREILRGDRTIGQAKRQLSFVHQQNEQYDLEINTFLDRSEMSVEKIIQKLNSKDEFTGWKRTIENKKSNERVN